MSIEADASSVTVLVKGIEGSPALSGGIARAYHDVYCVEGAAITIRYIHDVIPYGRSLETQDVKRRELKL